MKKEEGGMKNFIGVQCPQICFFILHS